MDCRDSSAVVLKMDINLSRANLNVSYVQRQVCSCPAVGSGSQWLLHAWSISVQQILHTPVRLVS